MRDFIIEDPLRIITVSLPDKHCVFCSHCSDVFYDYSNGPYLCLCTKDNDTNLWSNCSDFDDVDGDNNGKK